MSEATTAYQLGYSTRTFSGLASLVPFSSTLRSSHIPPSYITNNLLLLASLLPARSSLAATLKGLPRAYNKDLQEDKRGLFDAIDTTEDCVQIATGVLGTLTVDREKLGANLCKEMLATDLADYLVRKGVPFRETHHISGAVVRVAEEMGTDIGSLTLEQLKKVDDRFEEDALEVWDYEMSVERKCSTGGTSLSSVDEQIKKVEAFVSKIDKMAF